MAAAFLLVGGCGEAPPPARPPVPVVVAESVLQDVPVRIDTFGHVEAYATVEIKSLVAGQLLAIHFVDGQEVKKGDPLFTIDPAPFEAALQQARADLERDQAQEANAEAEYARAGRLFKTGVYTQEQLDSARASLRALKATVAADLAAVEIARLQLGYCCIRAPIGGRMGATLVDAGNLIKVNDVPMAVINRLRPIHVSFSVPEERLAAVRAGLAAGTLPVESSPPGAGNDEPPEKGSLTFVDNAVDRATGMVAVRATFPNEAERLWPGQFVRTVLTLRVVPGAVTVPSRAVETGQDGQYVWVVTTGLTARMQPVTAGASFDDRTEIEKGLSAGERVVVDGQMRLAPGAHVTLKPAVEAPASPVPGAGARR